MIMFYCIVLFENFLSLINGNQLLMYFIFYFIFYKNKHLNCIFIFFTMHIYFSFTNNFSLSIQMHIEMANGITVLFRYI